MNRILSRNVGQSPLAFLVLAMGGLISFAAIAADPAMEEVTVRAERPTSKMVGRSDIGVPIKLVEVHYHVSYADLDLSSSSGAETLMARVHDAAKAACTDLDTTYPLSKADSSCARRAVDDAMAQVNDAIKVAQAR